MVHHSINGASFTSAPMSPVSGNRYRATFPGGNCLDTIRVYFSTDTSLGLRTDPSTAPSATYSVLSVNPSGIVFEDDFETAMPCGKARLLSLSAFGVAAQQVA